MQETSFTPYHLRAVFYLVFLDEEYRDRFFGILSPDIFIADKELHTLAKAYWLFKEKYDVYPDQAAFVEEVFSQEGKNIELFSSPVPPDTLQILFDYFITQIVSMEPPVSEYITDITVRVIKLINLHKTISKYRSSINDGTVDTDSFASELLECTNVTDVTDVGLNALANLDKRTEFRKLRKGSVDVVPVNIPQLSDFIEEGGVPPGTLSFWLGATGCGKTTALITTTKIAILANKKTLYISAELSSDQILKRFDSAMTGIPIRDINDKADDVRNALRNSSRYQAALNNLVVHEVPMGMSTVRDVENVVKYYVSKKDWHPDLLVVDYADNLAPAKSFVNAPRLEIFSIYRDLRALGQKYNFAVWTASQLNDQGTQASEEDDGILSVRHVNEARGKAHLADLIIGIGRSKNEQQTGMARLQMVKNRFGGNEGTVVPIITNYPCSILWTFDNGRTTASTSTSSNLAQLGPTPSPEDTDVIEPVISNDVTYNINKLLSRAENNSAFMSGKL